MTTQPIPPGILRILEGERDDLAPDVIRQWQLYAKEKFGWTGVVLPETEERSLPTGSNRGGYPCIHRGGQVRTVTCQHCPRHVVERPVFSCDVHGECTLHKTGHGIHACSKCEHREVPNPPPP